MRIEELEDSVEESIKNKMDEVRRSGSIAVLNIVCDTIPVYYSELISCLDNDRSLSSPNDMSYVEGAEDVWDWIRGSIRERLVQRAFDVVREWEEYHTCEKCGDIVYDEIAFAASLEAFGECICSKCAGAYYEDKD